MSVGILPWPIVFVTTDLINEYFGERGVKSYPNNRLSYCLHLIIYLAMQIPVGDGLVSDNQFNGVFGQVYG
jgi:uncharacterized PurR-regulated membrane protein YhhQ (DUF165 family)